MLHEACDLGRQPEMTVGRGQQGLGPGVHDSGGDGHAVVRNGVCAAEYGLDIDRRSKMPDLSAQGELAAFLVRGQSFFPQPRFDFLMNLL